MSDKDFKIINSGTPATGVGILPDDGPAEPATSEPPADTPPTDPGTGEPPKTPEPPAPPKEPSTATPPASEPPKTETPAATPTEEEQLKALGYDEQFIAIAKQYKADGNINRYVHAASVDYSKMSPEQILRIDLQRQYPAATAEQLDLLYDTEVKGKYKLDADLYPPDGKDAQAAALKMKFDADAIRAKLIQENDAFKLPVRDLQAEAQAAQQQAVQQATERNNTFLNHDFSKSVMTGKKLVFDAGDGVPAFNYEINPAEIAGLVTNPKELAKYLSDGNGGTDPEAAWQMAAFLRDRKSFIQALINHGKNLGRDALIEEKSGPPKQAGNPGSPSKESLGQAFANRGVHGKGG